VLLALVDQLRCTGAHPETWLVARADTVEAGWMVHGVLGCPICRVERQVRAGVVLWTGDAAPAVMTAPDSPTADEAMRIGALVGFSESSAPFVICGREASVAPILAPLADAPIVLLDPPDDSASRIATIIRGSSAVPLAAGAVRGIVLNESYADRDRMASAVRVVVKGGRIVAPVTIAVPSGVRELARDERHWVGEREGDLITLNRAAPRV